MDKVIKYCSALMAFNLAFTILFPNLAFAQLDERTKRDLSSNILYLDYDCSTASTSSSSGTTAGDTLEGHTLPATEGGTGLESSGQDGTFSHHASEGPEYVDYYINMRWDYVEWNWDGTSVATSETDSGYQWFSDKPRLVLVTNPETNKSIITAALDSGPAPWTGVDSGPNNNPKQGWTNPQAGTPDEYEGRVSGMPIKAFEALGMTSADQKFEGNGPDLLYAWAPNQDATPGPTNESVDGSTSSVPAGCACPAASSGTQAGGGGGEPSAGLTSEQAGFVDQYHDIAERLSIEYGIPWETVMAQGILESAAGTSEYAVERNNFFGIGAFDSNPDNAQSYPTAEAGWRGYYENIVVTPTYRQHGVFRGNTITDPYAYLRAIKAAGYATDPLYVDKVSEFIRAIENRSEEKGWKSSATLAEENPEMLDNAAQNAGGGDGGGGSPSGSNGPTVSCGSSGGSTGDFIWPLSEEHTISGCWNEYRSYYNGGAGGGHSGMDIGAPAGTEIVASDGGKVVTAEPGDLGGFGVAVIIDHQNGLFTLYAHMKTGSLAVNVGDTVSQGQKLGEVNNTGHSFGDHLHFNIQEQEGAQGTSATTLNPLDHLPEDGRGNPGCIPGPVGGPSGYTG